MTRHRLGFFMLGAGLAALWACGENEPYFSPQSRCTVVDLRKWVQSDLSQDYLVSPAFCPRILVTLSETTSYTFNVHSADTSKLASSRLAYIFFFNNQNVLKKTAGPYMWDGSTLFMFTRCSGGGIPNRNREQPQQDVHGRGQLRCEGKDHTARRVCIRPDN